MMTPTELILMHLTIRPMSFNELMRATGLKRAALKNDLEALQGDNRAWCGDNIGKSRVWQLGVAPYRKDHVARDYSVEREKVAPGHTVVRFGDKWRLGHGQRPPATPGRANALGNIYA